MRARRFIVVGAGGQARETAMLIRDLGETVAGFVVTDLGKVGDRDSRAEIRGDVEWMLAHRQEFDAIAIGIGAPASRLRVADMLLPHFDESLWPALIHPTAIFDRESCRFAFGSAIAPGVIATVNVILEPFAFANFGCTLGHEARLGRGSVVNPGASVGGGAVIGAGALVGAGAQVLQYRTVGEEAIVGAGAVVTRDVCPRTTVVGVPARAVKDKHTVS